jgi:hypothetical protein
MDESFGLVIKHHLELQRRNRLLEPNMPLAEYRETRPSQSMAALEETQEWTMPDVAPEPDRAEPLFQPAEELWSGTPAFDWGD